MRIIAFIIGFIIGFLLVVGIYKYKHKHVIELVPFVDPNYVQTPAEAQSRLKRQGYYHGTIDGIWGSESQKAHRDWEKDFCDKCAVNEFKRWENQE